MVFYQLQAALLVPFCFRNPHIVASADHGSTGPIGTVILDYGVAKLEKNHKDKTAQVQLIGVWMVSVACWDTFEVYLIYPDFRSQLIMYQLTYMLRSYSML